MSTGLRLRLQLLRTRNLLAAAVPDERDRPAAALGGEFEGDDVALRVGVALGLGIVVLNLGLDGLGGAQIEGPEDGVHHVAGPVADRAIAERHPAPPPPRQVEGVIRPHLGRTKPQVPVQAGRDFLLLVQPRQLAQGGVVRRAAAVDRVDVADGPVPDPLAERADSIERVALVAQLRHDLVLLGRLHQGPDLGDGVGQRLLTVDVLASLDGRHRNHGVGVVGRPDDHRVDLLVHLVEHLAVVLVHLGVRELRDRRLLAVPGPQIGVAREP